MARVTIEDCTEKIPSRFELVVLAAQRAREIAGGAAISIKRDNDKNPVIALREIACGNLQPEALKELLIIKLQKRQINNQDLPDNNENMESMSLQNEIADEMKRLESTSEEDLSKMYIDEDEGPEEEL